AGAEQRRGAPSRKEPLCFSALRGSQDAALRPVLGPCVLPWPHRSATYCGSLRIIPEGCKPGVMSGPAPSWRGALPIDLPNPQLYSCSGHARAPLVDEATSLTASAGLFSVPSRAPIRQWSGVLLAKSVAG